jgi:hypothetical protein
MVPLSPADPALFRIRELQSQLLLEERRHGSFLVLRRLPCPLVLLGSGWSADEEEESSA